MGFFRRIEDYFQRPPANTISFSEAEELLRRRQLMEDNGFWAEIIRVVAFRSERGGCLRIYWAEREMEVCADDPDWVWFVSRMKEMLQLAPGWEDFSGDEAVTVVNEGDQRV